MEGIELIYVLCASALHLAIASLLHLFPLTSRFLSRWCQPAFSPPGSLRPHLPSLVAFRKEALRVLVDAHPLLIRCSLAGWLARWPPLSPPRLPLPACPPAATLDLLSRQEEAPALSQTGHVLHGTLSCNAAPSGRVSVPYSGLPP